MLNLAFLTTLAMFIAVISFGCATFERETKTQTYMVSTQQLEDIRKMLNIQQCPQGQSALALTIEGQQGGATVTVRCQ